MIGVLVLALLAQNAGEPHNRRIRENRRAGHRGPGLGLAFFEAFPVSGAGTTTACSTTAPAGAKGEALTFTRASAATCTKTASGGLATTGIADGDLVVLSSNVARVEYDSAGALGLLVESARTNVLLRYIELENAAWADVGTPTLTGSLADPFGGTAGVSIDDNDGAASEGRSQSVTVSAGAAYFMHCYVKAGTRAEATISIDGTTQAITGLSATTWSIVEKADASSSGVSIPIQVLVGDAVGDTGTVIWGGCQVEAGTYRTSIIPTTSAAVARAADDPTFTLPAFTVSPPFCFGGTVNLPNGLPTNARAHGTLGPTGLGTYVADSYLSAGTWAADSTQVAPNTLVTAQSTTAGSTVRAATFHDGTLYGGCLNATCSTAARAWTSITNVTTLKPGMYSSSAGVVDGIVTRIKFANSDAVGCR